MTPEILDIVTVSCDGRRALADVLVWSPTRLEVVEVRCEWSLGDREVSFVGECTDPAIDEAVRVSQDVLDEVREMVLYQRDLLREKN